MKINFVRMNFLSFGVLAMLALGVTSCGHDELTTDANASQKVKVRVNMDIPFSGSVSENSKTQKTVVLHSNDVPKLALKVSSSSLSTVAGNTRASVQPDNGKWATHILFKFSNPSTQYEMSGNVDSDKSYVRETVDLEVEKGQLEDSVYLISCTSRTSTPGPIYQYFKARPTATSFPIGSSGILEGGYTLCKDAAGKYVDDVSKINFEGIFRGALIFGGDGGNNYNVSIDYSTYVDANRIWANYFQIQNPFKYAANAAATIQDGYGNIDKIEIDGFHSKGNLVFSPRVFTTGDYLSSRPDNTYYFTSGNSSPEPITIPVSDIFTDAADAPTSIIVQVAPMDLEQVRNQINYGTYPYSSSYFDSMKIRFHFTGGTKHDAGWISFNDVKAIIPESNKSDMMGNPSNLVCGGGMLFKIDLIGSSN